METAKYEKALNDRRAELVAGMARIEKDLDAPMPKDWEDRASERQGDEVLESLGHAEQAELVRIDAALARIADGTYGQCLSCGEEVSEARLMALPDTPLCRNCAAGVA